MYQSLYRKYRPNSFDEVVGQKIIIRTLKNAIKNNTLSHAYLFTGPRGTGKTSIAKILAKTVNCENLNNYNPCNKCVNCTQYNNKQAVDIIEIDAASNNGVEEIRELRSKIGLVPTTGKYKIYIIDEVHMLSTGAFNALLKTLEEPPKHIIFILATTDPQKIPATILSRCQRFDFKKIDSNSMLERLKYIVDKEKISISDEAIMTIVELSDGGMRDALSILDQAVAYTEKQITVDDIHELNGTITHENMKKFIENIISNNIENIFKQIDLFHENGKDFYKLTEEIIVYLRNILIYKNMPNYFENSKDYEIDIDNQTLFKLIDTFNSSLFDMKNTSNIKLIFELSILKNINSNIKNSDCIITSDKIEENIVQNKTDLEQIKRISEIRINNTLCYFNKKEYIEFRNRISDIQKYLIDKKYTEVASLILDGEIKAYGNNYFIILFSNDNDVNLFNNNYKLIDELMLKTFNINFHGTAVNQNMWNKIKQEFNNKEKKYNYIEE